MHWQNKFQARPSVIPNVVINSGIAVFKCEIAFPVYSVFISNKPDSSFSSRAGIPRFSRKLLNCSAFFVLQQKKKKKRKNLKGKKMEEKEKNENRSAGEAFKSQDLPKQSRNLSQIRSCRCKMSINTRVSGIGSKAG